MVWRVASTLGAASLIPALWVQYAIAGNTTCASNQLDWYTSVVGESPCVTYQRLRQICNNDYQVPNFRPNTPGDQCHDQVSACCCNTVAFQLSMLCMNCQYDTRDGDQIGIDAGVGAYTLYKYGCGAGTNRSLPSDIQAAVCNQGIRLDNFLYGGWDNGAWYYVWTKENAERLHAANNDKTFTHCPNAVSPSSTNPTSSTTTSSTSTSLNTPTLTVDTSAPTSTTPTPTSGTPSTPSTSSTPNTSSKLSTLTSSSSDSGAVALITNSATLDISSLSTARETGSSESNSSSSHTNTGTILGGAIGGVVGGIIIIGGGIIFWCMGRNKKSWTPATPDRYYSDGHEDDPSMRSMAPMATQASLWTSEGPSSLHDVPSLAASIGGAFASPPGSHSGLSTVPSSAVFPEHPFRHEDGGPVFGLSRSASGRLPPAYRSWERGTDFGSNSGSGSASGEGARSGYSEAQSFGALSPHTELAYFDTAPSSAGLTRPLPSPDGYESAMPPLAPLRRSSTAKGWTSS
ncbi:hypothetical protein LXA43DRAFT_1062907 [Ganoderma leucocontextum]|nr:hypothetical protein LXA43DRAFT_1062907 [Ganoderma leucocontextum]